MKFSIAIVAAAFIAGVAQADTYPHDEVLYDVVQIQGSVNRLSQMLKTVDGTSENGALQAQDAVQDLAWYMKVATKDIQSTTTDLKDTTIISMLTKAYPDLVAATDKLVAIKPNLKKFEVEMKNAASLVKSDIIDLTWKTMWFTIALVAKVPDKDDKKNAARAVAKKYNSRLSATLEQYSDVKEYSDA
ncbi:unnamed protein product [Tilletia laevis]|uniref:Uncharacterized protein n=3 Tax=Tilletia TaxID=13289 RepID=A0A8X7MVY7_9BASI|nr:hypothetical protein CF336_g4056 [Tilletia laevis]KAE8249134.1 hypothetical protein A4X06_0g3366 [Tilletia controversa]CAD6901067.1 unnamed protein product [Tilletia caries]CAD6900334.1 unnamed protein product [Tilletia laevis]CAD6938040.1 unnamed protein product [Tilletia laevis]